MTSRNILPFYPLSHGMSHFLRPLPLSIWRHKLYKLYKLIKFTKLRCERHVFLGSHATFCHSKGHPLPLPHRCERILWTASNWMPSYWQISIELILDCTMLTIRYSIISLPWYYKNITFSVRTVSFIRETHSRSYGIFIWLVSNT